MLNFIDLIAVFLAGFLINFSSNIESFFSYVKIKSFYSGIIGFVCWMLTGLVFADILANSENKFSLVLILALGGGIGNFYSAKLLKFFSLRKKLLARKKRSIKSIKKLIYKFLNS